MQQSAEVRWFFPGDLPAAVEAWFVGERSIAPERRTDRYLLLPHCDTVGVKVREGSFEIKGRTVGPEMVRFGPRVAGLSDCWVKWSYADEPVQSWLRTLLDQSDGWLDVTKARRQRTLSLTGDVAIEVGPDRRSDTGCEVELTEISVTGARWWSLAFEAYGGPVRARLRLQVAAEHIFRTVPPGVPFDPFHAAAYPLWLLGLG